MATSAAAAAPFVCQPRPLHPYCPPASDFAPEKEQLKTKKMKLAMAKRGKRGSLDWAGAKAERRADS
jgi:hypothetical protein